MYRLYLDTCIVNNTFPLIQTQVRGGLGQNDLKVPTLRWAAEYVTLYHLLDLDDQWELEFGTWPSENEAVTGGKVATNCMKKQTVVISTVFGVFADLRQSMLREKPL